MEEGDYVRTKDGDLFILDDIVDNEVIPRYIHLPYAIWENEIIKSSPNIIDLIEVGDYVNGEKVVNIMKKHEYLEVSDEEITIDKDDIKSIVTKEQFKNIEYEVK